MKKNRPAIKFYALMLFAFLSGCYKLSPFQRDAINNSKSALSVMPLTAGGYCFACGIIDSMPATDYGSDSSERATVLGLKHVNPYLVPNMQQAYANLHVSITVNVTHNYVRFLPNSAQQMGILDSAAMLRELTCLIPQWTMT